MRGRLYNTIPLNVHSSTEDKRYDTKDSIYEEPGREFRQFRVPHVAQIKIYYRMLVRKTEFVKTLYM
jgi:hypothetical protein